MNKTVIPGIRYGEVKIPSSKSVVHRLMICAALGRNPVEIEIDGLSRDILATAGCLAALGAGVETSETAVVIRPIDRTEKRDTEAVLPAGESGSTLRFLLPVVGALGRKAIFRMEGRLSERPLAPFDRMLEEHGMRIRKDGNRLSCSGQLSGGSFMLPGNVSSQYFSGLLMALPLLRESSCIGVCGELESEAYVRLTEEALRLSGVRYEKNGADGWNVPGMQRPDLRGLLRAEGDWSNAAFYLCVGALSDTDAGICVKGLDSSSRQGDRGVMEILRSFGAKIESCENGAIRVRRGLARPLHIDAAPVPDLVPVLAVLCCAAEGKSEIFNAARVRLKESDRLRTTTELIRSCGGSVEEHPDGLTIHGAGKLDGGTVNAFNDHRIAMSAAVAACICRGPVSVTGAECVEKSYPAFWNDFEDLHLKA